MLNHTYDSAVHAIYIYLSDDPVKYTKELDENRLLDYSAEDVPVGIDLLDVSNGVDPDGLPEQAKVEKLLESLGIKMFAK